MGGQRLEGVGLLLLSCLGRYALGGRKGSRETCIYIHCTVSLVTNLLPHHPKGPAVIAEIGNDLRAGTNNIAMMMGRMVRVAAFAALCTVDAAFSPAPLAARPVSGHAQGPLVSPLAPSLAQVLRTTPLKNSALDKFSGQDVRLRAAARRPAPVGFFSRHPPACPRATFFTNPSPPHHPLPPKPVSHRRGPMCSRPCAWRNGRCRAPSRARA